MLQISFYSADRTFLSYVITKTLSQDVTAPFFMTHKWKDCDLFVPLYPFFGRATFLDPLCKVKFGYFYKCYCIPSLTKFLLCFNGWMFLFHREKAAAARFVACCGAKKQHHRELQKSLLKFQFCEIQSSLGGKSISQSYISTKRWNCTLFCKEGNMASSE